MTTVAHLEPSLSTPVPVPNRTGSLLSTTPDGGRFVQLLTWIEGTPYREAARPPDLTASIGQIAARIGRALAGVNHPAADRSHPWDLLGAAETIAAHAAAISDSRKRAIVEGISRHFSAAVRPRTLELPWQVIHNDINDLNLLVTDGRVVAVIDYGDVLANPRVVDVAVAATYAMLKQEDPLAVGRAVVVGFETVTALSDTERSLMYDLIRTRLALSVTLSAARRDPANPHLSVTEADAWDLIERLEDVDPAVGRDTLASR
jgi:Ser/Thr protein kinase RdoA (MazF antagonist)